MIDRQADAPVAPLFVAAMRNYTYDVLSDAGSMQKRFTALLATIEKENAP